MRRCVCPAFPRPMPEFFSRWTPLFGLNARLRAAQEARAANDDKIIILNSELEELKRNAVVPTDEQASSSSASKGKGKGKAVDEDSDHPKAKAGWMNKIVALLAALENDDWKRVEYLQEKFSTHHSVQPLLKAHQQVVKRWGKDPAYDY